MTGSEAAAVLAELREFRAEVRGELKPLADARSDHETRIRSLERVRYMLAGIALMLGGGVGAGLTKALGG